MSNSRNTVLYVGMSKNLAKRISTHKNQYRGFTAKYNVVKLVYFEFYDNRKKANKREKQIKNLVRRKKEELINQFNPNWRDLSEEIS